MTAFSETDLDEALYCGNVTALGYFDTMCRCFFFSTGTQVLLSPEIGKGGRLQFFLK